MSHSFYELLLKYTMATDQDALWGFAGVRPSSSSWTHGEDEAFVAVIIVCELLPSLSQHTHANGLFCKCRRALLELTAQIEIERLPLGVQ